MTPLIHSDYLDHALNPHIVRERIKSAVNVLRPHRRKFDTIAFRGVSGALYAPILAQRLNKHLLCVRKQDQSHSCYPVEGNIATQSYLIVDDFISSGRTIREMVETIRDKQEGLRPVWETRIPVASKCYGILLYNSRPRDFSMMEHLTIAFKGNLPRIFTLLDPTF